MVNEDDQRSRPNAGGVPRKAPKARDIIAAIVDHRLAGELKTRGFRKKGFVFTRRHGETGQVIRLDLSSWNSDDRGMFGVSVAVMFDAIKRIRGQEPPRLPGPGNCEFFSDLRGLVEGSPPTWQVDERVDIVEMSEKLCGFVVDGVLSRLDRVETLGDFEATGWVPAMHWRFPAIYAYAMGRWDEAEKLLREEAAFFADRGLTYEQLVEWCRLPGLKAGP